MNLRKRGEVDRKKMSRKKVKTLSKRCPECSNRLSIIEYSKKMNGVVYTERYEECDVCDYSVEIKCKRRAKDNDTDSEW